MFCVVDRTRGAAKMPAQDSGRVGEDDTGLNTGGGWRPRAAAVAALDNIYR